MDPRIWDQVGLELIEVNIEGSIKSEGGCYGGYYLGNQSIKVCVGWPLHCKIVLAQIINGLSKQIVC